MNILISNDDGYLAPGIQELARRIRRFGNVTVVAPEQNHSGASNSLTLNRPLSVRQVQENVFFVNGTPSDCVHIALTGLLPQKPDIVLSPNSLEGELKSQYENIGVESYFLDLKSTEGMYESILALGKMLGKEEEAEKLHQEFEDFKNDFAQKHNEQEAPTVLILMGLPGSYVVATESSYVGSLVKLAGGVNVYGDGNGQDFLNINPEDMVEKAPDIILRTSHALPEQVKKMFAEEFATNDIWKHFEAVQNARVYDLDNEKFGMSANFQYEEALKELETFLYQEGTN